MTVVTIRGRCYLCSRNDQKLIWRRAPGMAALMASCLDRHRCDYRVAQQERSRRHRARRPEQTP